LSEKKTKMAIIGFGGMAEYHLTNLREYVTRIEVVGAYDIREEAKANIIKKGLKLYGSPDELYTDNDIELVLIATPNNFHKPYAIACLNAGKHVISEKPVTLNCAELLDILDVSRKTGKVFTVHHNRRWDSDYLTVKNILHNGILNKPYVIESRVQGSRRSLHGWRGYKVNGGGMLLDWGIHLIDQMLDFFSEKIVEISAHLNQVYAPEVDDNFTAMFRFENGLTYIVNVGMNSFIIQPRWHISCEDGTVQINNWDVEGKIVKLSDSSALEWAEDIVYTSAGPTRSMAPRPKETTMEIPLDIIKVNHWPVYFNNVADAINGRSELIVKPTQLVRLMKVIDAVFESDIKKQSVICEL